MLEAPDWLVAGRVMGDDGMADLEITTGNWEWRRATEVRGLGLGTGSKSLSQLVTAPSFLSEVRRHHACGEANSC